MEKPIALLEKPNVLDDPDNDASVMPIFGGCLVDPGVADEFGAETRREASALDEALDARCSSL